MKRQLWTLFIRLCLQFGILAGALEVTPRHDSLDRGYPVENCDPATASVASLRAQRWPRTSSTSAPKISNIVYINLESDKPRREFMERQLRHLANVSSVAGLRWQRLVATTKEEAERGTDAGVRAWREKGFNQIVYPGVQGSWGQAACTFSHRRAISQAVGGDEGKRLLAANEFTMIVEDDSSIHPNFAQKWAELWPYVPEEWDVLHVGGFGPRNCTQQVNAHVDRAGWSDPPPGGPCAYCGTQAYLVHPKSVERVLHRLDASRIFHTDALLDAATPPFEDPERLPELRSFYVFPLLAGQAVDNEGGDMFLPDRV